MLAIGFIRQFQYVYRDSETIEGAIYLSSIIHLLSECKRSVVHTWICLTKKNSSISSVYVFDGLYYRARRGSASKQHGEKSPLITILFSST